MNEAHRTLDNATSPRVSLSRSHRKNAARVATAGILLVAAVPFILTWLQMDAAQRRHAIFVAIRANDAGRVARLLNEGADPNLREPLPVPRSLSELIDRLLNPQQPQPQQPTPLLAALCVEQPAPCCQDQVTYNPNPNPAIVGALLSRGADPNATDAAQWPPISAAVASGNSEVVGMLLQHGVPVDQRDVVGATLLLLSASQGHTRMMRYLIAHGADVHAKNTAGETALICAVRYSRLPDAVAFLLEHHIDPNIADKRGKTALFYARKPDAVLAPSQTRLLPQVIHLLTRAGAR